MAKVTCNVDGQLPPALNVRKPTPGKHQQAKLALSRAGGKRAKCDSSCGKGGRNRQNVQYPRKAAKKINTQLDIRYAFFDPAPGPRVRLSAASLINPLQAPILLQEVDHDPMPKDEYEGSSEQSRGDTAAANSSALPPRDLLPLQLKTNPPLLQAAKIHIFTPNKDERRLNPSGKPERHTRGNLSPSKIGSKSVKYLKHVLPECYYSVPWGHG